MKRVGAPSPSPDVSGLFFRWSNLLMTRRTRHAFDLLDVAVAA